MSLYIHVRSKDEILSSVLDLIVNRISIPDEGSDWSSAIKEYALSARSVFKKYPWATALMNSHLGSGPSRLNYYDSEKDFEFGIDLILSALKRMLS